jgi:predicted CXXCH cytochrome family protein
MSCPGNVIQVTAAACGFLTSLTEREKRSKILLTHLILAGSRIRRMLRPPTVAVWAGLVLLLFVAAGSSQQPAKPQPPKAKANSTGGAGHEQAKPVPGKSAQEATPKQEQGAASGDVDPSKYAGSQACIDCHENAGSGFATTPHGKTLENQRPDQQGCEACHGAGKAHAESGDPDNIVRFESVSKAGTTKICSTCHDLSQTRSSALHASHGKAGVGCLECHSVHSARVEATLLKSDKTKLCTTCHADHQH